MAAGTSKFRLLLTGLLATFFVYVLIDQQMVVIDTTKFSKTTYTYASLRLHLVNITESLRSSYVSAISSHSWKDNEKLKQALQRFPSMKGAPFKIYQLDVQRSNAKPLSRDVPDTRPTGCSAKYADIADLPTVSIVMPMHNEVWSMLLRSVHSIIDRTDWRLLKEIIIVDDNSTFEELRSSLDDYVAQLPVKTFVLRNPSRQGLMRSRVNGAHRANGTVIVFMDAHTEVNHEWLPPLLREIVNDPMLLAIPHLDTVNPYTIEYDPWRARMQGTFGWDLDYAWKYAPKMPSDLDLVTTSAVSGSVMASRKDTFFHLGSFDEGMDIWGGENVEIVFRYWMCGGRTMIVPCSRVGHMFRPTLPYTFPRGYDVIQKNFLRIAEVWMDDYKHIFYASKPPIAHLDQAGVKSLRERIKLKERLQCKNFTWYLTTVAIDVIVPEKDTAYHGLMMNVDHQNCLELEEGSRYLTLTDCVRLNRNQQFSVTTTGLLVNNGRTICIDTFNKLVVDSKCAPGGWKYDSKFVDEAMHKSLNPFDQHRPIVRLIYGEMCLTYISISDRKMAELLPCEETKNKKFHWMFSYGHDPRIRPHQYNITA